MHAQPLHAGLFVYIQDLKNIKNVFFLGLGGVTVTKINIKKKYKNKT